MSRVWNSVLFPYLRYTWSCLSCVVKHPDDNVFLEATLGDDDFYEVNPMYLWLPAEHDDSVSYNAMLKKVEALDLLHRTLGHDAVQRIEDAINTGHVE